MYIGVEYDDGGCWGGRCSGEGWTRCSRESNLELRDDMVDLLGNMYFICVRFRNVYVRFDVCVCMVMQY